MIRALVFDFDGVIVDTETPLVEAWVELHAEHGIACDRAHAREVVGHVGVTFDLWAGFGARADRAALEQAYRLRARALITQQPVLPGVCELLRAARARGLRIAIASNSDHAHVDGHLDRLGLRTWFDAVCCVDDVAAGKPAPDLYLLATRILDAPPGAAIAFEDSVPGHTAAKRAGVHTVVVPNPSTAHCRFPYADLQLPSLAHTSLDALLARFSAAA
ncbi:MAG TPA: HAD family phosphatase [Opitutaceae bacterium]